MKTIIIATIKPWNIKNFSQLQKKYLNIYNIVLITNKDELNIKYIQQMQPTYIFFPHWSWLIPKEIHENFESIVFHMTDLPYGKGGSPLQNLIEREKYKTKISAIKVEEKLDNGDIYLQKDFDISLGSAEEIFIKMSKIIFFDMIPKIMEGQLQPASQNGKEFFFKRRKPEDSNLNTIQQINLNKLYDFIRMLDADGYPKAYININGIKIELSEVHLKNDKLTGRFEVIEHA